MKRPLEILVSMLILGVGAVLFVAVGAMRDLGSMTFPVVVAVPAILAVVGLWMRWHAARPAALVVAGLLSLGHMIIVLGPVHWGFRVLSGVLAAAYAYAVVLLLTKPARLYLRGVADE